MPPGSATLASSTPAAAGDQLRKQLRRLVETASITTLRQGARLWGWPVKGTGKANLVDQVVGYLADEKRMRAAFQEMPHQERTALGWLLALQLASDPARSLQRALALSGLKLTLGATRGLLQNLQARLLIFGDEDDGYDGPDLFREWLPALSVPGLQYPGIQPQARVTTLTEIARHSHYLLSVVQGEHPAAHLPPPARPRATPRTGETRSVRPAPAWSPPRSWSVGATPQASRATWPASCWNSWPPPASVPLPCPEARPAWRSTPPPWTCGTQPPQPSA